jgi:hypothetical protein
MGPGRSGAAGPRRSRKLCTAEQAGGDARVRGGCGVRDEMQGVRGSQIKAGPGISACGPGTRARRRFRTAGARGGGKRGEGWR